VLRLEDVRAGYGSTTVLHGVDLEVEGGEIVAVLGRNGVGKTTMLRAVMGHVPLRGGRVLLDGEDLGRRPVHERARRGIAYVPQGREIFPGLSVLDNLRVAAYAIRRPDWREALERVLHDFPVLRAKAKVAGASLSGGQQQILALARALMSDPGILLLDEPSEGIQPSIVMEISETVRALNETRGITVVLVEQNLDFAARLARRAYLMDHGQVVRDVPAEEVLHDRELQHEYMGV
jgi:branched-chain amino acid transport system ATP-binding protein/urea transport system ATP-binding protein